MQLTFFLFVWLKLYKRDFNCIIQNLNNKVFLFKMRCYYHIQERKEEWSSKNHDQKSYLSVPSMSLYLLSIHNWNWCIIFLKHSSVIFPFFICIYLYLFWVTFRSPGLPPFFTEQKFFFWLSVIDNSAYFLYSYTYKFDKI